MIPAAFRSPYLYLAPPYRRVLELEGPSQVPLGDPPQGEALLWNLAAGRWREGLRVARDRPGGLPLIIVLPRAAELDEAQDLLGIVEQCRPQSILPHHARPAVEDLVGVLRRPPENLPIEMTDYLAWRGIHLDGDTRHILRRTIELSAELRTVSALSRSLYLSRRALGRRFLSRGLPVPSHWLHFCRVLRAAIRLQNSDESLFAVGCELGYTDGFALSNQMYRLTGIRPSTARERLGWEWIAESWLRTEAREGALQERSGFPVKKTLSDMSSIEPPPSSESEVEVADRAPAAGSRLRPRPARRRFRVVGP